jgi:dynein heavy chain
LYSSDDRVKPDDQTSAIDEFEVMRQNSPWPKRNHNCFYYLNVFMERCNDVLELVQTMRHFQILSKTVSIGGSDNQNMDILAQEIHEKYVRAINEFQYNVSDVMGFESGKNKGFEVSFFHLRTTIKELERELSQILNLSIKHCTTIGSKLRLLQVFEGVHERGLYKSHFIFVKL